MAKGISEVIAIILIMMITISIAGLAYAFLSSTVSVTTSATWDSVDKVESNLMTQIKMESMSSNNLYIRNMGQNTLRNFSVYINDEPADFDAPDEIQSGQVGSITIYNYFDKGDIITVNTNGASTSMATTYISNEPCQVNIWNTSSTYTISQSNKYYCLRSNLQILGTNAIVFNNVQNSTLDCQGYVITGDGITDDAFGVFVNNSNAGKVINCNVNGYDWGIYAEVSNNVSILNNSAGGITWNGISVFDCNNTIIKHNSVTSGLSLWYSDGNVVDDNTASNNAGSGNGISLTYVTSSNITNNIATGSSIAFYMLGSEDNNVMDNVFSVIGSHWTISLYNSPRNTFVGGSIHGSTLSDYLLDTASYSTNFTNTNFTASRMISIPNTWFNYRNDTSDLWLKTNGISGTPITRTLNKFTQSNVSWNERTYTGTATANYTLTGLLPSTVYRVYNFSTLAYTLTSSAAGSLNFTIRLNTTNREIKVSQ